MSVTFGLFDSFDLGDSTPGQVIDSRLDFAVEAEAAGFGHYHVTEHHGTPLSVCPSPSLFLAALSQRTTSLRMGALVHVLPMYEPLRLAEEIATLDQLTHGRLDVGVGSGVSPYELAYFGVDPAQARPLFAETLKAVTDALATGRMRHKGTLLRDYDAELSVTPVQRPHPPLWYASNSVSTAEWAAANSVSLVGRWAGGAFAEAARAYWRAWRARPDAATAPLPRLGVAAHIYIGATDADGVERFRKANGVHVRQLTKLWHDHGNHGADALFDTDAVLANGNSIAGSAQTVRDLLVEKVRQAPVNYVEATLAFGDLTPAETTASLAAFAETVMPAVREAAAARSEASLRSGEGF